MFSGWALGLDRLGKVFLLALMNMKYKIWFLSSVVFLGAVSCKEKPNIAGGEGGDATVVKDVADKIKDVVVPKPAATLSDEERAAKLGFVKFLPAETEIVMSFYNAEGAAEQLKALKLYGLVGENMGMGGMVPDPDEDIIEEELLEDEDVVAPDSEQGEDGDVEIDGEFEEGMGDEPSPWMLLGQEVTIAMGKTTGEQVASLLTVNRRMGYFQAKAFGKAAQIYAKTGNMNEFSNMLEEEMSNGLIKNLLEDPESGIALLEKAEMPPLYMAFRAKEGELDQAAQLVNGSMAMFGMAGEMAAPVEFETGGASFAGYKLLGAKMVEAMESERESMEENLSPKIVDGILAALGKKNLVVVTGTVGDYVVFMLGGSEESLKLADDVKGSLVGTDELDFTDPFADKKLVSLIYGDKEVWKTVIEAAGGLSSYALGMRDGIAGGGGLGETRDLEAMLQIIADREKALLALGGSSDLGMIAYAEEGLKIESFGGYDKGAVDWDAKTTLAHLGESGDNMLFFNAPSTAAYDEKLGDYVEAIVETLYAATIRFSELEIEAPEMEEMKQYTKMFDGQFREDLVGLYGALSGSMSDGLGNEAALVIDLKGTLPTVPGVPQKFLDDAKAPRVTLLAPVKDRKKLVEAWEEVNVRSTSLLGKVSEMAGEKIPMQKPISSEKDGMTTWFFAFPFFQNDFLPSVTVSDDWFAASTSKTQAQDLMSKAQAGGEAGQGVEFYVNFNAITGYADEMLDVVDRNSAELFKSEYDLKEFNDNKAEIKKVIAACSEFESLNWTIRKESGNMHSSIHFKTR
jgi:hypothetical protein